VLTTLFGIARHLDLHRDASLVARCGIDAIDASLPQLELDEIKTRQVIVNLLVNAAKFSPVGATVRVATRRDGEFVVVEVIDQGPGIRPDDATHIFSLFGQGVRAKSSGSGGLGIGLHLVKRLSELHGGHVGVNSHVGHGSTFWVRLPIPQEESSTQAVAA